MKQAAGRSFLFSTRRTFLTSSTFTTPSYRFLKTGRFSLTPSSKSNFNNLSFKDVLFRQKRFVSTNPLNPYSDLPPFTSPSQIVQVQHQHLSWSIYKRVTQTKSGENIVSFEVRIPRVILALLALALFGTMTEFFQLQSEDKEERKKATSKIEKARETWALMTDQQFIKLAISTIIGGIFWGAFRSARFLKWFPQFSVKTYTQLFTEKLTRNFILRNMIATPILGLVTVTGSLGSVFLAWTLFQPTEEELKTGNLTPERKLEYLFKQFMCSGLFPLVLGWATVTIQPYAIVPAWIGGTLTFSLVIKKQSIPMEPRPTAEQMFFEVIDDVGLIRDPDPWQAVIEEERERKKKLMNDPNRKKKIVIEEPPSFIGQSK